MVWWYTKTRHGLSVSPYVRRWISGSLLDRWIMVTLPGIPWFMFFFFLYIGSTAIGSDSPTSLLALSLFPWLFWGADAIFDYFHTRRELDRFRAADDVILATRSEYLGGHPQLPQGRLAYLLLEGTLEHPNLTIGFPAVPGTAMDYFQMPLLDLIGTSETAAEAKSIAADLIGPLTTEMSSSMKETATRFLRRERLTLIVDYAGPGGGGYKVELTNFFGGNEEIRDWRNYMICAKAEALSGVQPYGDWKSLRSAGPASGELIPVEVGSDGTGNGSHPARPRSAFARR